MMQTITRNGVMLAAVAAGFYAAAHINTDKADGQLAAILAVALGFIAAYGISQHFAVVDRSELDRQIMLENARKRQAEKRKATEPGETST
jgi:ribosomal protein L9